MTAWRRLGMALLAGAFLGLPFQPSIPWGELLLPLAVLPLFRMADRLARGRASVAGIWLEGYLFATGMQLVIYHWIPTMVRDNLVYPWIMAPTLLLMALYLAIPPGLGLLVGILVARRTGLSVGWIVPLTWAAAEWMGGQTRMGFTWSDLAYSVADVPLLLQPLDLWGLYAHSGVLLFVLGGLVLPARRRSLVAAAVALLVVGYGAVQLARGIPDGPDLEVALIQPNLSPAEKWTDGNQPEVVAQALRLSDEAVGPDTDVLFWPETATPFRLLHSQYYLRKLRAWTERHQVPILTGTPHVDWEADTLAVHRNAAVVIAPGAEEIPIYRKQQLVPFSEWLPWRFLRLMEINFGQADFTPGTSNAPLPTGSEKAGMLLCIETIFPRIARRTVNEGATYLVVITNDVWFGRSAAIHQHSSWAKLRSVETRRPLVRCGNTGVSMLIDRCGRVTAELPIFEERTLRGLIRPESGRTLYVRFGDWMVLLGALAVPALLFRRRAPSTADPRGGTA